MLLCLNTKAPTSYIRVNFLFVASIYMNLNNLFYTFRLLK
ncbi:hypothetical protein YTXLTZUM_CDS0090 [Enterococcus phage VRE9_3]